MAAMFAEPGAAPVDPFADLDLTSLYDGIEALADRAELVHVKAHVVADGDGWAPSTCRRRWASSAVTATRGP